MLIRTPLLVCSLILTASVLGQKEARNAQKSQPSGMILPVECSVMANGALTDSLHIPLYKDNGNVADIAPARYKNGCILELDMNSYYTVVMEKPGYRGKSVAIDTHMPEGRTRYKAYKCSVNLEPLDKFEHSDPWYLDFPSAVVRWDVQKKSFTHSAEYLADIQTKMALLGAQMETK